jgi:hypothetical protein
MLRRIALIVALTAAVAPAASRAHEWEEDYTDDSYAAPPDADVDVDVDVDASVTFDSFHGALAPYGQWVVVGSYGRVWRPHVASGWRPYYYGRWEWTNEGWLWVSDEPWGWAAYHYGRWAMDPSYGWIWVPGYQWAPAWVSWRYSGDVVGWAPLGPGVSVYVSVTSYHDHWWTFVPCRSFVAQPIHRVAYRPSYTRRYWHATSPAPAYRGRPGRDHAPRPAWGGPPPRTIEQRVGRPVTPVRVVAAPAPGAARVGNGEVAVYRPGIRGWSGRRPEGRASARDDGRPARRGDRDLFDGVPSRGDRDQDRSFVDRVRPRREQQSRAEQGGTPVPRQDRGFGDVAPRRQREAPGAWSQPDRGTVTAPSAAPAPRQDAPRFVPRGNGSHDAAPRAERSWSPGGGRGGGDGAPRAMAPPRGGGDRGPVERRGHR